MAEPRSENGTTVDPITFEILSHRLHQISMEIAVTLERVGGTVNTTQMHDYMTALYRPNGDVLCAGESIVWHVACASVAVKRIIERFADDDGIFPGDMFLLNDPYVAAIHQSDVYVISPIHVGDRLVAWSATFVHVMDIGAMSPGGNSPNATEICHEGVRIPGIKFVERGKLRRDVFDAIINMTRQPAMVALDLRCEIAANNVARARVQAMCEQYGADLIDAVSAEMNRYSERILRSRLREIPDGSWTDSGAIETSESWNVCVKLTKTGDQLVFDFTGTDPQAKVGINLPIHATLGACYAAIQGLLGWDLPKNHGALGPIELIAPVGTIVNAQPPAPVSLNTTSGAAVVKFLAESVMSQMVATSDRWRDEVMARSLGGRRARHAGTNQYGQYYVSTFGGLGGSGATATCDGVDTGGGVITVHNVEWVEQSFPLMYLFRRHVLDGGGAGRLRGGAGDEVGIIVHDAPTGRVKGVAYGVAGTRNSGRGVFGGYPGAPSVLMHYEGTNVDEELARGRAPVDLEALGGQPRVLPYCDFDLEESDIFFLRSSNGGGFGDPLDRDPALVLTDVQQGLVSSEVAQSVYGVALDEDSVDRAATERTRATLRVQRRSEGSIPESRGASADGELKRLHPITAGLEVAEGATSRWIRCAKCGWVLGPAGQDWAGGAAAVCSGLDRLGSGWSSAGLGHLRVRQQLCPACGALFDTSVVVNEGADQIRPLLEHVRSQAG